MLDLLEREEVDVSDVGRQVEQADDANSDSESQRQIALRIAYLFASKSDVVPCIGGEESADHADADQADRGPAPLGVAPEVAEVGLQRFRVAVEQPEPGQRQQSASLCDREHVLNEGPLAQAAGVDPGENTMTPIASTCCVVSPVPPMRKR